MRNGGNSRAYGLDSWRHFVSGGINKFGDDQVWNLQISEGHGACEEYYVGV